MNDLRTNNVRGYLAEFLVARAVGSVDQRVEWAPWDVTSPDGTRIEVKSAGYLQAWTQKKLSVPIFRVAAAYGWDGMTGTSSTDQSYNADVYVFCLHTATTPDGYDPLQVSHWRFYVTDRSAIEAQGGSRMGLATLQRVCGDPVAYPALSACADVRLPRPIPSTTHRFSVPRDYPSETLRLVARARVSRHWPAL